MGFDPRTLSSRALYQHTGPQDHPQYINEFGVYKIMFSVLPIISWLLACHTALLTHPGYRVSWLPWLFTLHDISVTMVTRHVYNISYSFASNILVTLVIWLCQTVL